MRSIRTTRSRIGINDDASSGNCVLFTACVVVLLIGSFFILLTHREVAFVGELRRFVILQFHQPSESASLTSPTRPIPKLLHYAFETELIPLGYAQAMKSCIALNPDWKFYLWTNADLLFLVGRLRPELFQLYSSASLTKREINHLAKFPVLYSLGGVFLEPDFHCLRPLNEIASHHEMVSSRGAFLASERPENHMILENAEFKLSWSAMGAKPGHEWFQFALDLLGGIVQPDNDLNLDESFLTECHIRWQRRIRSAKNDVSPDGQNDDGESPALLPWQIFSPTLRDPQTMRRLCDQLRQLPSLASVYTVRHAACNNTEKVLDTGITNQTVGHSQYNLRRAIEQSELLQHPHRAAAAPNHKVGSYINATEEWNPVRYAEAF